FGDSGVRLGGVARDITEAHRFAAALLAQRLAGSTSTKFADKANRPALDEHDVAHLPEVFSATGFAELVYEPDAAKEYAVASIERAYYDAVYRDDQARQKQQRTRGQK